ncbi:AGAP000961-PA-like protein [Anopheles sinensis]|uniref:AGAP000961-PA-like protein n=1 Tax=Anopheles sinensis TaxID=74873 RepID=A0A084WCA7_ANOSI|nr:AGAP000961-PA-like protein [Anopheles sinensis]
MTTSRLKHKKTMRKLSLNTGAGMSRQSKTAPQAKKVMPPAVPDIYGKVGANNGTTPIDRGGAKKIGSGVSSDNPDGEARKGVGAIMLEHHNHGTDGSSRTSSVPLVTTTAPSSLLLRCGGGDVVVDYVMDDQGIDLTQSPGRDSPVSLSGSAGSGSRNSTASLDSGRASSYLTGASNSSNRSVSGVGSYGVLSSPRCSVSSCSIGSGSVTGGNSSGAGSGSHRLSNHSAGNNRCDHDIISDWLMEIHFQEYTYLFLDAGYDLSTIARMTPEDLTAIGIRKPNHRERLKRHIDALRLPDPLPGYVPGSIEEWLRLLRLDEYIQPLLAQGYQTVHDVTQLTWEDLEDIGIVKLGHQKKILLAIKRVKDIINGKMMGANTSSAIAAFNVGLSPTAGVRPPAVDGTLVRAHYDDMSIGLRSESSKQHHLAVAGSYSTFLRQQPPLTGGTGAEVMYYTQQQQQHGGHAQLHPHQTITYPHVHFDGTHAIYRRSSYDDSDITPTNEKAGALLALSDAAVDENGTTNQSTQRQRPIAKIVANNLKLPGVGVGSSPPIYPAEVIPMPPMLGHIENVEMATAALDAMHFSNYTSSPYAAAVQFQHHHSALSFSGGSIADEASGTSISSAPVQQQQQQPIYHNQASSSQSTPSPPTLPGSCAPGGVGHHLHTMVPFAAGTYAGQMHQTTVEVHKVSSQHDNKSNSSLESIDQIPFANENAGTIKQRSSLNRVEHQFQQQQQQLHSALLLPTTTPLSSSVTSMAGSLITTTTTLATGGCMQQELSPSTTGSSSVPIGNNSSAVTTTASSSTSSVASSGPEGANNAGTGAPSDDIYGTNVLNDIGNMLANLTDELDAMLEEEKCAGISDIE